MITARMTNAISQMARTFRSTYAPTVTRSYVTAILRRQRFAFELATLRRNGARTEVYRVYADGFAAFVCYADALRLADHDLRAALYWAVRRHRDDHKRGREILAGES